MAAVIDELFIGKILPPVTLGLGSLFPSVHVVRLLSTSMKDDALTLFMLCQIFPLSAVSAFSSPPSL